MRELTINLNLKAETPLYEQIYHYIKQDIQDQKILAGEKLPSSPGSFSLSGSEPKYGGFGLWAASVRGLCGIHPVQRLLCLPD